MGVSDHGAGSRAESGTFGEGASSYALNRGTSVDPSAPAVNKQLWLDAWNDPVAGISAYTPCMHACNLMGDGDYRLIVADGDRKLKVWKGTAKASEHALLDVPTAITSFNFIVEANGPCVPALAVAAGSHLYIYRNLRPYYKFVLPNEDVNNEELHIWNKTMEGQLLVGAAVSELTGLQDAGVALTTRSLQLLNIADPAKKVSFVEQWQGQLLISTTVITCLDVIKQAINEPNALSCLVVGTESGRVLILNPSGTAVVKNVWVGVTPAFLAIQGELDVGYTITVAGRDGKLYQIKNGELSPVVIQLDAQPVGLVRLSKHIIVGCMNEVVHSYLASGHKSHSIYMPAPILCLQGMELENSRNSKCLAVALSNGEVRIYRDKTLVSLHTVLSPVTGLWFGTYGREDNTLITICKSGSLDIKIMPRTAKLDATAISSGPPPEQDIPLQVPKKTRLYVEQTQRERDCASDMHRTFQRDLAKLRLTTARAYVKVLTDGQGPTAFTSSANLSLNLSVHGLGPRFRLVMTCRNEGSTAVQQVPVALQFDPTMYRPSVTQLLIPLLVPSLSYMFEIDVDCLDPAGGSDTITVIMAQADSNLPILQAKIVMPLSELNDAEF